MLYLTINTKAQDIRTTTVASKSVAVLGRHIRFCNSDVDYVKTAAELVEHDLRDGLLEIHSCKQCKHPFIDKPDSKLSNCPDCTNLARAIAKPNSKLSNCPDRTNLARAIAKVEGA